MATTETNLADRSGNLVESHKGYQPRVVFFYFVLAALLLVLVGGLAYQQLFKSDLYSERERVQSQRRVLIPGPRGNIYDRNGNLLVGNKPRLAVVIHLDELRSEFLREYRQIRKNYRAAGDVDVPDWSQLSQIARASVVQRYLDQVNAILGRSEKIDSRALTRHFSSQLLLPYTLLEDLEPTEYAQLLERLPVTSPLQVYTTSARYYPYGSAAAHALGLVAVNTDVEAEDFPGDDLRTFKMKGASGKSGLEHRFDSLLQGEAGGRIYRVNPGGFRINPPLEERRPKQGQDLVTSLDIDLQRAAELALEKMEMQGAAVALDIQTGEVLALVSKPDYDPNDFVPRLSVAKSEEITAKGAWYPRAVQGLYPPGSSFKMITAMAALRAGIVTTETTATCTGLFTAPTGGRSFKCTAAHGTIDLAQAIEKSCNVYFYKYGSLLGPDAIAAEARRFHLHEPTGLEITETTRMVIPDREWKKRVKHESWYPGDTAQYAIGQADLILTPLQMAAFTASFARGETVTKPTLLRVEKGTSQHSAPIGLAPAAYETLVVGMERVTGPNGTAKILSLPIYKIPGLQIAGKTGTAQKHGEGGKMINYGWFIGFAPVERPEIAIAVVIEGAPGEETGGGRFASPVAHALLKQWWEKKQAPKPSGTAVRAASPVR